jgi:hypothetical protein
VKAAAAEKEAKCSLVESFEKNTWFSFFVTKLERMGFLSSFFLPVILCFNYITTPDFICSYLSLSVCLSLYIIHG